MTITKKKSPKNKKARPGGLSKTTFAPVSSVSCGMSSMATADPEASFRLGLMYEHGSGELESDPEAAAAHYEQAAVQGHPEAQVQLGLFYASGLGGLQQDDFRAAELYTSAANLGSASGQCRLGICYETGKGVELDTHEAERLFRASAQQNFPAAQCLLGNMYEFGIEPLEKDPFEALPLYEAASKSGFKPAREHLTRLRANVAAADTSKSLVLDPVVGSKVEVFGQADPELNGRRGTVMSFDDLSGQYKIRLLGDYQIIKVDPENIKMSPSLWNMNIGK